MREVLREYFQESTALRRTALEKGLVKIPQKGERMLLQTIYDAQRSEKQITVSEISQKLGVTKSAVSQMMKNIKETYINKTIDENDRRKVYITLTEEGKIFLKKQNQHMAALFEKIAYELGEPDCRELIRIFKKIANIIEQNF